ncbi:tyrosine-type recombinase/integrase [Myceligenerans pegani]|uniref:Tyrosine-type recombinase/integrase n=1 Tax=Myceligenerans pegani TaxID=2776917 RepID=A0ABR9MV80_9MICO|nr:tyrosine-type recombinase/integrase [Myceligenerans sp. TRM 65318]MBE1874946.1 tyrosine-type recombinase/integrase [Myceligenerans sp. TRM 65318]MBE3017217.1 tyrosine-type recombinase/integrase [Myceligenerans sp. TRM 65318]
MVAPPRLERLTVDEAVRRYLAAVEIDTVREVLSPATARSYTRDVTEFARLAGPATVLDDISGSDVDTILVRYQSAPDARFTNPAAKAGPGRSTSTVNRFRQSVSRFFSHAARECWVQADPMQWASPPARSREPLRTARTALSAGAARSLLSADDAAPSRADQDLAARDRLVLALLLVLGPRVSELARADLADISRSDDHTTWRIRGKGGSTRTVALSPPLAEALDAYLTGLRPRLAARRPDDADAQRALLLSWRGRRIDTQAVRGLLRRAVDRMPSRVRREATPHALRHTTATVLVAEGWDVKVVAELLGHASIATTGVYLDRIDGELAAAIRSHPLAAAIE